MHSPDTRIFAIAARQHSVFTRAQAIACGFTPKMIQGRLELGLWKTLHRGVYGLAGTGQPWRARLMAASLATDGHASHQSAAALFGVLSEGRVEVLVPRGTRRSRDGVTVHESGDIRPGDLTTVDGIPSTSLARTFVDLAAHITRDRYEELLDLAITRRPSLLGRLSTRATDLSRGDPGATLLGSVLAERTGSCPETRLERRVLRMLQRRGITNFVPQVWVTVAGERFRLDLADIPRKIAIEADENHHAGLSQWKRDVRRQNLLVADGFTFLRFTEDDVTDENLIFERTTAVLARVDNL